MNADPGLTRLGQISSSVVVAERVNIYDAKTNLSRLIERVEAGEEIVIARSGRPVARLVPMQRVPARVPGSLRGRIQVAADFDDVDDLVELMEGSPLFPDGSDAR